eukprot:gnl/MRDRNA2_/MRDRNA2_81121_c0_seq1.p1 gnl/MRDRNA2_/MRDRNA2_81121_c0~~gnl/MRDRNA2_/MRDRNA2_81121_c0_seq1.p1  ORF type:complete len:163 (+),score=43.26 gnl/MRDRNA2_/MRDRNA2_81121_c0_seq1:77-565(+)
MKGKGKGMDPKMMEQMCQMMMMESMNMMAMMGGMGGMKGGKKGGGKGRKRKEPDNDPAKEEIRQRPKNKFLDGIQLIITKNHKRNMTKDDVTWTCEQVEGGKYQTTVTVTQAIGEEGGKSFTGEPADSQREAEMSAATIAYENMTEILEPLVQEHKAKQRRR